ncbi:hypothetical protein DFH06DRAFT_1468426 [Mycena polygramma]|nr:hypothetical protein DFH06DRAFT_1468426 [Mycena polygramma]
MTHEIFSHITDFYDLLCLSMSCQILWEIGREHLYHHIAALVADHSWVGDRIICIGEFLQSEDVPEAIVTPAKRTELFQYPTLDEYLRDRYGTTKMAETPPPSEIAELLRDNKRGLWYYPFRRNRGRQAMFDQEALLMPCYSQFEFARRDMKVVTDLFKNHEFAPLPPTLVRVLRNLSRRQYIGPGEALQSRICLSSDDDVRDLTYDGGIHRGVWASDRFDIVAAEWLEECRDDPSWTDVSEEAVKEMGSICELDYF